MSEETLLVNDMTPYGLRRMHIIRMGAPVEKGRWVEQTPLEARELLEAFEQEDKTLGIWHLWLVWNARERVRLHGAPGLEDGKVVLWWALGRGQALRESIRYAAVAYLGWFEKWPEVVKVRKLPKGAPEEVELYEDENECVKARLVEAQWAPKGVLIMDKE